MLPFIVSLLIASSLFPIYCFAFRGDAFFTPYPSRPTFPVYEQSDSVEIEQLLCDSTLRSPLDYARQFINRPYIAHTLEGEHPERLVINLRGMDCATLVETTLALTLTHQQGKRNFKDYCQSLEQLRYFNGRMDGYLSRLHYLSFWIADHIQRHTIREVAFPRQLTRPLLLRLNYMSQHPTKYAALQAHTEWIDSIARMEQRHSGYAGRYMPKEQLRQLRHTSSLVHDGDIIVIVTRKAGLDYFHQGLAVWGEDQQLHLFHASSDHQRILEDKRSLYEYLRRIPHALGIRVFRLNAPPSCSKAHYSSSIRE